MHNLSFIGIFLEGILSFISPCVLPLIPVYMSYLTASCKEEIDGEIKYKNSKVLLTTIFFVLGISTTFFIMGLSLSFIKDFISDFSVIISMIGGIILILFALNGFGIISVNFINKEYRIENKINLSKMNYLKAYFFGFIFSFAWTPCIGPMLANVILVASNADVITGNLYLLLYALGFTIPFLLLGIFYKYGLEFISKHKKFLMSLSKVASIIILFFGLNMVFDASNEIIKTKNEYNRLLASGTKPSEDNSEFTMMYDFSLKDQNGNLHELSDYEGDYIVMNFIASWCTYCVNEIPSYHEFANQGLENVKMVYVMSDMVNESNGGKTIDEFIKDKNITLPVLYDDGTMFRFLGINSFPMMVFIGPDGSLIGYQSGMMDLNGMKQVFDIAKGMYEKR